jgi:hypothetical protein
MTTNKSLGRKLVPLGVAALAFVGVIAGATPTTAQPIPAKPATAPDVGLGCSHITVIEPTIRIYTNQPVTSVTAPPVGSMAVYLDPLNDMAGNQVGNSAGQVAILYVRESDGHEIEQIAEHLVLPGGILFSSGFYDRSAILAGQWVSARIKGVSGRYAGMSGTWTWRLTSLTPPFPVEERIVVCGRAPQT